MGALLRDTVERLERDLFFRTVNAQLERLRDEEPEEWDRYINEIREWRGL